MAIRSNCDLVKNALQGVARDGVDFSQFVADASVIVDLIETNASDASITMSDALLINIETYLAAHLYALAYPQGHEKEAGRSRVKYGGKHDLGFDYTRWGQMAKRWDISGTLQNMDEGLVFIGIDWLGTEDADIRDAGQQL